MRYIIGVLLCICGSAIIILNDKKPQAKTQILNDNVFVGLLFGLGNICLSSLSNVAQKVLTKEGMDIDLQVYYFGIFNCIPSLIVGFLIGEFNKFNLKYVLYVSTNGLVFYSATYLMIVFTFILCAILLGEPVFFTDVIGAAIIICFQYYNFKFPPGRVVKEINDKESNIIS